MGIKQQVDKTAKNIQDSIDEAKHRSEAELERQNRDANGAVMTPGEKVRSHVSEAKHEVLAEVDKVKRNIRDHT